MGVGIYVIFCVLLCVFGDTKPIFSGESSAERFGGPQRDLTMGLIFFYNGYMMIKETNKND